MKWTIYLKQHLQTPGQPHSGHFLWKHLCIVFDHEALGLMERALKSLDWEYKVEKQE